MLSVASGWQAEAPAASHVVWGCDGTSAQEGLSAVGWGSAATGPREFSWQVYDLATGHDAGRSDVT